jgi:hypothetical protein
LPVRLSSDFLSGMFWLLFAPFPQLEMLRALSSLLAWVNFGLATFNLLPGFPLDGGRIFRALAWRITGSYERATRLAGRSGRFMAYAMIVFGSWRAMAADLVGGLWIAFLGWFLLNAAQETVIQATIRSALAGLRASDVMSHEVPTVAAAMPLDEYSRLVLRTGHRCHFVLASSRLLGLMNIRALNGVPREAWHDTTVQTAICLVKESCGLLLTTHCCRCLNEWCPMTSTRFP